VPEAGSAPPYQGRVRAIMKRREHWDLQRTGEPRANSLDAQVRRGEFLHIHVKVYVCCCIWRAAYGGVFFFIPSFPWVLFYLISLLSLFGYTIWLLLRNLENEGCLFAWHCGSFLFFLSLVLFLYTSFSGNRESHGDVKKIDDVCTTLVGRPL
jgi:hypothetical protein